MKQYCVGDLLKRRAAIEPEGIAAIQGDVRITFSEMNGRVNAAVHLLQNMGIGHGDRIAVLGRNSISYVELYFASAKLGAILCGLNIRLASGELDSLLEDSGARALFTDSEFFTMAAELGSPRDVPVVAMQKGLEKQQNYERLRDRCARDEPVTEPSPDDPLVLVFTSGTTGRSKGAVLTQSQMYWASATQIHSLDYRHHDVNLIVAPMFHVGGLSLVTLAVHLGQTALLHAQWDAATVLRLIEAEGVHHFFAVPVMLKSLLDALPESLERPGRLRWIVAGGAPTPPELIHAFAQRGICILQSYGATETGGPASCLLPDRAEVKAHTVGRAYFDTEIRVIRGDGCVCSTNEIGEIQVRGPHVFAGYWNDPEATRQSFDGDWLRTGDLGSLDVQGDLCIAGRARDMIITGGENVYPAEVELVLQSHPSIAEVVVVGQPDPDWGETLCAVVVLRAGSSLTQGELESHCRDKLARYKIPRKLRLSFTALPRNSSGKILRQNVLAGL